MSASYARLRSVERHHRLDERDGHAEPLVDAAVPLGVALGEVVVDGDEVDALAELRPSWVDVGARSGRARGSRRTSCLHRSSSRRCRPRAGRCRPSSGRRTCAGRTRAGAPRARRRTPRRAASSSSSPFASRSRNSAVFARSSSSESARNSGSSVAMYAACSARRFMRRPSPKRRTFSKDRQPGHRHRVPRLRRHDAAPSTAPIEAASSQRRRPRPPRPSPSIRRARTTCSGRSSAGDRAERALAVDASVRSLAVRRRARSRRRRCPCSSRTSIAAPRPPRGRRSRRTASARYGSVELAVDRRRERLETARRRLPRRRARVVRERDEVRPSPSRPGASTVTTASHRRARGTPWIPASSHGPPCRRRPGRHELRTAR